MELLLGSQSPRRREILAFFALPFHAASSHFDESSFPFKGDPVKHVCGLSRAKAEALYPEHSQMIIITADTAVYKDGKIYGKPKDRSDAIQSLSELAGASHSVFTGITLQRGHEIYSRAEETKVQFNPLTPKQIEAYHDKLHLYDKAGSYQVQMAGGLIVRKIEGCYYNVMGLPINTLRSLLVQIGIDLWDYLQ